MNYKKIFAVVLVVATIIFITIYGVKNIVFPYKYKEYIDKYSQEYDVDPLLVLSVIKGESNFNSKAESNKGAKGLMQIMDSTGQWISDEIGIKDFTPNMLFDEETNIRLGCWYLKNLEIEFGSLDLALAAYNAGSGNVTKWLKDERYSRTGDTLTYIPFAETKKYVDKVKTNYNIYKYFYRDE
jgi:soluble lytic murein transglycosylase